MDATFEKIVSLKNTCIVSLLISCATQGIVIVLYCWLACDSTTVVDIVAYSMCVSYLCVCVKGGRL